MAKSGTGTKGLARKHQSDSDVGKIRYSQDVLEQYAYVTKMLGNGMCEIYTNDENTLMGHIRNKFRGRQKRNNIITVNSIVLVGLREWESIPKNCDILTIYDDNQIEQLKNIPNVNIDNLLRHKSSRESKIGNTSYDDSNFVFTHDDPEQLATIIEQENFKQETGDRINIDDI